MIVLQLGSIIGLIVSLLCAENARASCELKNEFHRLRLQATIDSLDHQLQALSVHVVRLDDHESLKYFYEKHEELATELIQTQLLLDDNGDVARATVLANDTKSKLYALEERLAATLGEKRASAHEASQGLKIPTLIGAEYFSLPDVVAPKKNVFVAQNIDGFLRWIGKLGSDERKAIQKRLNNISSNEHFGDVAVTQSENHKSNATVYEMRFHQGGGPRIYYLQIDNDIVILNFGLKSEGTAAQNRAVRRAGEIADEFLAAQP